MSTLPVTDIPPAVVWLDDINNYADSGLHETLTRLVEAGLTVVATIRRAAFDDLTAPGDLRNPAGEALADHTLVERVDWQVDWSPAERNRLHDKASHPALLAAVDKGVSPSVYSVAGPELLRQIEEARRNDEWPARYQLVQTVLTWYRTGIGSALPVQTAVRLMPAVAGTNDEVSDEELRDACDYLTTKVIGGGRKSRQSVLMLANQPVPAFQVHEYVLDHDQQTRGPREVPDPVWGAALTAATTDSTRFSVGVSAAGQPRPDVAISAFKPLAEAGLTGAQYNLGVLLATRLDPPGLEEARRWYTQAAEAGHTDAQNNLGVLLATRLDPPELEEARRWYTQAAEGGDAVVAQAAEQALQMLQ